MLSNNGLDEVKYTEITPLRLMPSVYLIILIGVSIVYLFNSILSSFINFIIFGHFAVVIIDNVYKGDYIEDNYPSLYRWIFRFYGRFSHYSGFYIDESEIGLIKHRLLRGNKKKVGKNIKLDRIEEINIQDGFPGYDLVSVTGNGKTIKFQSRDGEAVRNMLVSMKL
jgi:hypothetical protein